MISTDILVIGAGPAGLSTAISLVRKAKAAGMESPKVLVVDKGRSVGSHVLSGAVIDPSGFEGLLTAEEIEKLPVETKVTKESFRFVFSGKSSMRIPWVPPMMQAEGCPVGSLTKIVSYLASIAAKEGVGIYTGYAITELIEENGVVVGARTGEKGLDGKGGRKSNYLASEEIRAKTVVLAEGACGILTEKLIAKHGLAGKRAQTYAVGVKELIEVPAGEQKAGEIMHTFGYPVDMSTYGGGFVYHVSETQVMVGYALGLDYKDASLDPHRMFREFKASSAVAPHIANGKSVAYGAKIIPEGGYYALPTPYVPGALIVGDGAGMLDGLRIKGVHIALQCGQVAAEAILAGDIASYPERIRKTTGYREIKRVRNFHGGFHYGTPVVVMMAGFAWATFGLFPFWMVGGKDPDSKSMKPLKGSVEKDSIAVGPVQPDRLTDVFMSGTRHEEDQPCHLKILSKEKCEECAKKFGSPCTRFCPAEVYVREGDRLQIDFSNCLHCKTCKVKCPMENIDWTFPQGGDGPRYTRM